MRGIDAEPWDLGEPLHRLVVFRQQVGHLPIELSEVILDHAITLEPLAWSVGTTSGSAPIVAPAEG
jgi:hypothetical protein